MSAYKKSPKKAVRLAFLGKKVLGKQKSSGLAGRMADMSRAGKFKKAS